MTYQFGQQFKKANTDFILSVNDAGDFTITSIFTGREQIITLSQFANAKKYNCFEVIVRKIFENYPENASVYFSAEATQSIANIVKNNKRGVA